MNNETKTTIKLFVRFVIIQSFCAACILLSSKLFPSHFYFVFFGLQIPIFYSNYNFFKKCFLDESYFRTFQIIYYLLFLLSVTSIFSWQYEVLQKFDSHSFNIQNSSGSVSFDLWYYSVVTFATVGYGDITPISISAKTITIIEVINSMTFLILVISNFHSFYKKPKDEVKIVTNTQQLNASGQKEEAIC